MKTGTDTALIGLLLVVVAVIVLALWGSTQVEMAAAQAQASAASSQLPMAAVIGGEVTGWVLKTLLGMVTLAIVAGVIAWAKQWWKSHNGKRAWRNGPNAQWQRDERGPRPVSDAELMRMMMYQQMTQNGGGRPPTTISSAPVNDDLPIDF